MATHLDAGILTFKEPVRVRTGETFKSAWAKFPVAITETSVMCLGETTAGRPNDDDVVAFFPNGQVVGYVACPECPEGFYNLNPQVP